MNILIIDFFNLIKRYTFLIDDCALSMELGTFYDDVTTKIINRLMNTVNQYNIDMIIVCSDSGYNHRANSILNGKYKANRNRAPSLTQEEKESNYINKLRIIMRAFPCLFFEVKDVEADNIIYFALNFFRKKIENSNFMIATTDTDLLQLIDDNVSILNWNKGIVDINNWKEMHGFDSKNLKPKDYALFKSIVGDGCDNIDGIKGIGWKTVLKILDFVYSKIDADLVLNNVNSLIGYYEVINESYDLNAKEKKFVEKILSIFNTHKDLIYRNQSIIALDLIETPFISKIMNSLDASIINPITFDQKEFLRLIKFKERWSSDVEYEEIKRKSVKSLYTFKRLAAKSEKIRKGMIK